MLPAVGNGLLQATANTFFIYKSNSDLQKFAQILFRPETAFYALAAAGLFIGLDLGLNALINYSLKKEQAELDFIKI